RSMSPGGCADQNLALRVEAQLKKVVSRGQYVVMSGSLLPSLGADYYGHLIGIVRLKGGIPILDTSGKALLAGLRNKPFLIKPNQEEAQHCLEGKLNSNFSLIKAVQWFKEKGAENSIISLGKGGAVGMFDEVIHTCQLDNMGDNFGSTVGCGDVLLGCFLAQCRAGISRGVALRLSVAAATASMSFLKPGFFTRTQMIRHIASTGHKIMVAK
ncbi:MAG: tagatose 6-phosphate kinase, partial [Lysobacterales bacterium]